MMILIIFVIYYKPTVQLPDLNIVNWRIKAFNALSKLDYTNMLRGYVAQNDTNSIENELMAVLPSEANFKVVICDARCGDPGIESEKITSVNYLLAGDVNYFSPRQVVVYLW
jgi:hypothetical protein